MKRRNAQQGGREDDTSYPLNAGQTPTLKEVLMEGREDFNFKSSREF